MARRERSRSVAYACAAAVGAAVALLIEAEAQRPLPHPGLAVALVAGALAAGTAAVVFAVRMRRARWALADLEQAHQQLAEREQYLVRTADAMPVLVSYVDRHRRYRFVNRLYEAWFRRPLDDVLGRTTDEVLRPGPGPIDHVRRYIDRALSGEHVHFELEAPYPGGPRWVNGHYIPDFDNAGQVAGFCVFVMDVTERKVAEEALQAADRRKDEFLATLAHELRNPLAAMRNAVNILKLKDSPDPDSRWVPEVVDRQLQHMSRLLEDLLDVSRIAHDKLVLRPQRVDLSEIVGAAIETCRPHIEAGGHELTVSLPAAPVQLDADPVRLAQVFANLLANAAKYTLRGGHIRIAAALRGLEIEVSVKDDGIGISAEMLPRLFEMFSQGDWAFERAQGGLGLGLSLVRGLVHLHGGRVEARSAGLGRGSEFTVRLPAVLEGTPPPPEPGDRPSGGMRRRVLIADDMRDNADILAALLRMKGHQVYTAYDGEEAIAKAAQLRPDVVILDLGMPKCNGLEACRQIRELPSGAAMTLIALTGWGRNDDRNRTDQVGFDHHFVKPVNPAMLLELLSSPLSRQNRPPAPVDGPVEPIATPKPERRNPTDTGSAD